jgi:hypothetical protein
VSEINTSTLPPATPPTDSGLINTVKNGFDAVKSFTKDNGLLTSLGLSALLNSGDTPAEAERTPTNETPTLAQDFANTNIGVSAKKNAVLKDLQGRPIYRADGGIINFARGS